MSQYPEQPSYGYQPQPPQQGGGGKAIASLVLGIIGMIAWCIAICGGIICIVGLILGIMDLKGPKRTMALWGVVLNSIGLLLSLINFIAGLVMMANGTHPMMQ